MAEVLITLGVIGVVAALTMPSLIANYQKKVWVNQLKKTYATLNEGFRQIMVNEGCTDLICAGFLDMSNFSGGGAHSLILNESNINKLVSTFKLSNFSKKNYAFDYEVKNLNGANYVNSGFGFVYSSITPDGIPLNCF